jgi:hypothetical protein
MNAIRNTKLCLSCDGEVHIHAYQCSHCGQSLLQGDNTEEQFTPPYQSASSFDHENTFPEAPYKALASSQNLAISDEEWSEIQSGNSTLAQAEESQNTTTGTLTTVLLMSLGVTTLLFGLLLLLFARDGVLTLSWTSSYWPLYLSISAVSLYFGWNRLQDEG